MARRSYGTGIGMSGPENTYSEDNDVKYDVGGSDMASHNMFVSIMVIVVILVCVISFFVYRYFSSRGGAADPGDAAVSFVKGIVACKPEEAYMFLPREVRSMSNPVIDDIDLSHYCALTEQHGLSSFDVSVVKQEPCEVDEIRSEIMSLYGRDIRVGDAMLISLDGTLSFADGFNDGDNELSGDLVVVKSAGRWYVMPGLAAGSDTPDDEVTVDEIPSEDVQADEQAEDPVEDEPATEEANAEIVSIEYQPEVVKQVDKLEPYKKMMSDLKKGKVKIDGEEYEFPVKCEDLEDFVRLDYAGTGLHNTDTVSPNFIMNNVPVKFVSVSYDNVPKYFAVGNMEEETVPVADGSYTTAYLAYPVSTRDYQVFDYPTVYLPGNVTFGTPYASVAEMYEGMEQCYDLSHIPEYLPGTETYQIELEHPHNYLYLQFFDGKLAGMGWYYFDFNEYNEH